MKQLIRSLLGKFGCAICRTSTLHGYDPGSVTRPIGEINLFLEDVRARDFVPRGILDVGAYKGEWARMALFVFPKTPILMIEPQDEMMPFLSKLTKAAPNCHHIKAGAGRNAGELVQTLWDDHSASSFLPAEDPKLTEAGKQRKTRIITIDSVLAQDYPHFIPDLVKLDVQGFELEALSGAESLFGRTEIFILEVSLFPFMPGLPLAREVITFMAARDYELYDIPGKGRRPYDGALGQLDLAFVKAKGRFRKVTDWRAKKASS